MSTSANGTEGNIHVTWGWGTSHKLLAIQGRPNWTLCELKLWLALPKSKGKNKIKWKLWSTNMCWLQRESIFHSCNTHALYDVGIGFSDGATLQWSTANKPRQWQNLGEKTLDWTFGVEAGYYWGLMGIIYYIIACRVSSKVLGTITWPASSILSIEWGLKVSKPECPLSVL